MATKHEQLKDRYEILQFIKQNLDTLGVDMIHRKDIIRKYRDQIAELQAGMVDPLARPLTEASREQYRYEGESGYEYIIMKDDGSTDDELSDWFDSSVAYPPINSPYDCTGKRFTWFKHINRTPAGIVVIHGWSLDI